MNLQFSCRIMTWLLVIGLCHDEQNKMILLGLYQFWFPVSNLNLQKKIVFSKCCFNIPKLILEVECKKSITPNIKGYIHPNRDYNFIPRRN